MPSHQRAVQRWRGPRGTDAPTEQLGRDGLEGREGRAGLGRVRVRVRVRARVRVRVGVRVGVGARVSFGRLTVSRAVCGWAG